MTQSNAESSATENPSRGEHADDAAAALKSSLTGEARHLGEQAKSAVQDVAEQAREGAGTRLSGGKDRAAQSLETVADALRHTGEHLRQQDQPALPEYIDRVAESVQSASTYLRDRQLSELVDDVQSFARREPAIFFGGVFALGLLGGRFLKSSRPSSGQSSSSSVKSSLGRPGEGVEDWRSGSEGSSQSGRGRAQRGQRRPEASNQSGIAVVSGGGGLSERSNGVGEEGPRASESSAEAE